MKARMVLKLRRPILQEPSTRSTRSACALVLHVTSERVKRSASLSPDRGQARTPQARKLRQGQWQNVDAERHKWQINHRLYTRGCRKRKRRKKEANSFTSKTLPFLNQLHFSRGGGGEEAKTFHVFILIARLRFSRCDCVIAISFFPDPQISPAGKAGSLVMS